MIGSTEGLLILLVVLVLFGGSQVPKLARALGSSVNSFKKGLKEGDEEELESALKTVSVYEKKEEPAAALAAEKKEPVKKAVVKKTAAKPVAKKAVAKTAVKKATAKPATKKTAVKKTTTRKATASKAASTKKTTTKSSAKKTTTKTVK